MPVVLVCLGFSVFLCGAFGVLGGLSAVLAVAGERTTAHVTSCETHDGSRGGRHTTCYGTWRSADGREHRAVIEGASGTDEGGDVTIRAWNDVAQVDGWSSGAEFVAGAVPSGLAAVGFGIGALVLWRRRRAASRRPYPPGRPYPPRRYLPPRRRR